MAAKRQPSNLNNLKTLHLNISSEHLTRTLMILKLILFPLFFLEKPPVHDFSLIIFLTVKGFSSFFWLVLKATICHCKRFAWYIYRRDNKNVHMCISPCQIKQWSKEHRVWKRGIADPGAFPMRSTRWIGLAGVCTSLLWFVLGFCVIFTTKNCETPCHWPLAVAP